jgi:nitrate reductase NapE
MTKGNGVETSTSYWNSLRRRELLAFLVLAFGIWPIVAVGVVGAFGFTVWMWQIVFGPPGPPPNGLH